MDLTTGSPGIRAALATLDSERVRADLRVSVDRPTSDPSDHFRVTIAWVAAEPLLRGRAYTMRLGDRTVTATVSPIRYRLDLATGEHVPATTLSAEEVGVCELELSEPIDYVRSHDDDEGPAVFTLHKSLEEAPAGAGVIQYALRRGANVHWQALSVAKHDRAALLGQRPVVIWLTGLSGAGKSTIANRVARDLHHRRRSSYVLDGDNVRHGLNADLGFTDADRVENVRRVAEVARLMVDAGLIVIVSFISPFKAERSMARSLVEADEFVEVHIDTPLAVAEQRDPKGLYRKARRGELANFTGIDSPYERPEDPELRIDTVALDPVSAARLIVRELERRGRIPALDSDSDAR